MSSNSPNPVLRGVQDLYWSSKKHNRLRETRNERSFFRFAGEDCPQPGSKRIRHWDFFGILLGFCWNLVGAPESHLGYFWDIFGILGEFRDELQNQRLGYFWDSVRIFLGFYWDFFWNWKRTPESHLGYFWDIFGILGEFQDELQNRIWDIFGIFLGFLGFFSEF